MNRWIIVNAADEDLAWSGRQWVEHAAGTPCGGYHVSNFDTPEDAAEAVREAGLDPCDRWLQ